MIAPSAGGTTDARDDGMDFGDVTARVREQRFQTLVSDLLPRLRRINAMMDDESILELAESIAELKLLDEELPR